MKRILIMITLLILVSDLFAPAGMVMVPREEGINIYLKYWNATSKFESDNDQYAFNDKDPNGGSWGIVQIGQLKLDDFNLANGTDYELWDCFDVNISRRIFMWHYMNYGIDIESACKAWNGSGPATEDYWREINDLLTINN